jgi:hypothetical protein
MLPVPSCCFGFAENNYDETHRNLLFSHLSNELTQGLPWPKQLKLCFSNVDATITADTLLGTPSLDVMLGKVEAVDKLLQEMFPKQYEQMEKQNSASAEAGASTGVNFFVDGAQQMDINLAPEKPSEWVQCEQCLKWRRVPWDINIADLPDSWNCTMSTWDPENANCDTPQDAFDPEKENVVEYSTEGEKCDIGDKLDVYCVKNLVYYEAKVVKLRTTADGVKQALFHFLGWKSGFDEWIDVTSERIAPYRMYTMADKTPRGQESLQKRKMKRFSEGAKKISTQSSKKSRKSI